MTPIEGTVRLMENLSVTGKLSELNVGQVFDLAEQFHALFSAKPTRSKAKKEEPKPVHVVMGPPVEDPFA